MTLPTHFSWFTLKAAVQQPGPPSPQRSWLVTMVTVKRPGEQSTKWDVSQVTRAHRSDWHYIRHASWLWLFVLILGTEILGFYWAWVQQSDITWACRLRARTGNKAALHFSLEKRACRYVRFINGLMSIQCSGMNRIYITQHYNRWTWIPHFGF